MQQQKSPRLRSTSSSLHPVNIYLERESRSFAIHRDVIRVEDIRESGSLIFVDYLSRLIITFPTGEQFMRLDESISRVFVQKKKDEKEGKERRTQRERERGGGRSRDGFEWECVDKSTDHRPQIRKFDSPCKLPRWIIRSSTRVTESLPPSFPRIISFVIALITGPGYFVNSRSMFS